MEANVTAARVFDAPIAEVWKIFTEAELVKQWWGPDHFTCPTARMDFREGGVSVVAMKYPKEMGSAISYSSWAYTKIIPMKSIEYIQNLSDENGVSQDPVSLGMPADFPRDIRTIITFEEVATNKTEVVIIEYADFGQITGFAKLGLEQCMDKAIRIKVH